MDSEAMIEFAIYEGYEGFPRQHPEDHDIAFYDEDVTEEFNFEAVQTEGLSQFLYGEDIR